jgi:ubiquinone/menaquinone biosynthesis C-methylase UbiE
MAAIYDRWMRGTEEACLGAWRAELLTRLAGDVLEVGAGTGANVRLYPPSVRRLVLAEPDPHMRARLAEKARERAGARVSDATAEALPFPDGSFDAVVATLVLCSVRDPGTALSEMRRVLRDGGRIVFLEHVASDEPARYAWQRRIEPLWKRVAGNCHLTRRTAEALEAAGFEMESIVHESVRKSLPFVRPSIRGYARKSGA